MTAQYKVMCGCECGISSKSMYFTLLKWRNRCMKHLKDRSHNAQNRKSGKISSHIFGTYNNDVRPHNCHIYNTTVYMAPETMFTCNYKHHGLPQWKHILRCCDKCPNIVLPIQETNKDTTNMCLTIRFHIYRNVSRCTVRVQHPYHEWTTCSICYTVTISDRTSKKHTQK